MASNPPNPPLKDLDMHQEESAAGLKILQLKRDLFSLKQQNLSISEYFNKQKVLFDEISRLLRPITTTTTTEKGGLNEYLDRELFFYFIMGLNEKYSDFATQLIMINPPPSVSTAYSLLLDQEEKENSSRKNKSVKFQNKGGFTDHEEANNLEVMLNFQVKMSEALQNTFTSWKIVQGPMDDLVNSFTTLSETLFDLKKNVEELKLSEDADVGSTLININKVDESGDYCIIGFNSEQGEHVLEDHIENALEDDGDEDGLEEDEVYEFGLEEDEVYEFGLEEDEEVEKDLQFDLQMVPFVDESSVARKRKTSEKATRVVFTDEMVKHIRDLLLKTNKVEEMAARDALRKEKPRTKKRKEKEPRFSLLKVMAEKFLVTYPNKNFTIEKVMKKIENIKQADRKEKERIEKEMKEKEELIKAADAILKAANSAGSDLSEVTAQLIKAAEAIMKSKTTGLEGTVATAVSEDGEATGPKT